MEEGQGHTLRHPVSHQDKTQLHCRDAEGSAEQLPEKGGVLCGERRGGTGIQGEGR